MILYIKEEILFLMVGFVEEAIFRGLMLQALKARGLWQAAVVTALLFWLSCGRIAIYHGLEIDHARTGDI